MTTRAAQRMARIERLSAEHAERLASAMEGALLPSTPGSERIGAAAAAIDAWGVREFGVGLRDADGGPLWDAVQAAGRMDELLAQLAGFDAAVFAVAFRMEPSSPVAASAILAPGWLIAGPRYVARVAQQEARGAGMWRGDACRGYGR